MTTLKTCNPEENINKYRAFYYKRTTTIKADSKYSAHLKAMQYFKPEKKTAHRIIIKLVEKNNKTVFPVPDF